MRILSRAGLMAGALLLSGCVGTANEAAKKPLLPDQALRLSASTTLPLEAVAAAALAFAVIDPLAPNWTIESQPLGGGRYGVALTMKRFVTGGEGEARQVFRREAERLARSNGAADFRIATFEEGIESEVPVARRVARGIIELY